MVTSRKVNHFVRRRNAAGSSRDTRRPTTTGRSNNTTEEDLRILTRCATMNETHVGSQETSPCVLPFDSTNLSAKIQKRGILRRRNSAPHPLRPEDSIQTNLDPDNLVFEGEVVAPLYVSSQHESISSVSTKPTNYLDLNSPSQLRPNSGAGMGRVRKGRTFPTSTLWVSKMSMKILGRPAAASTGAGAPSQQTIVLPDLEEQLRSWSIKSDSKISEGTQSTTASPYISILRHQKKGSEGAPKEPNSVKQFTASELSYLEYVLDTMYKLIVGTALDKSGVQYRKYFCLEVSGLTPRRDHD